MANSKDWMKELWDDIKSREIWHVKLPGTHNSGVFSAWNTIGVRNQDRNIREQLDGGVRAFDIRVMKKPDGTLVMHHSGNYPPNDSQDLKPALEQMSSFVVDHAYEVFLIRLAPGYGSNLGAKDYPDVRKQVLDKLESYLVPWSPSGSYTLGSIRSQNKNIILISSVGKESGKEALFWDDTEAILKDTWREYQSDCGNTPQEKIDWLKPHIGEALTTSRSRFLWASSMIWTINLYDAAVAWTNPKLCDWLLEWAVDPARNAGMNIFGVDFFEVLDNRVVNTIVALNKVPNVEYSAGMAALPNLEMSHSSSQDVPYMPYFRDSNSFSEHAARKTLASVGLDLKKYEREYQDRGALTDESFAELESKGVPKAVVLEYVKWYESQPGRIAAAGASD